MTFTSIDSFSRHQLADNAGRQPAEATPLGQHRVARRLALIVVLLFSAGCGEAGSPGKPNPAGNNTKHARDASQSDSHLPSVGDSPGQPSINTLLDLMEQRLLFMHEVARTKWNASSAITDNQREQALVEQWRAEAARRSLNLDEAEMFLRAQMTASKTVQQELFELWSAEQQTPFRDAKDLATELRPKITQLGHDLFDAFEGICGDHARSRLQLELQEQLQTRPRSSRISARAWQEAIAPLLVLDHAAKQTRENHNGLHSP